MHLTVLPQSFDLSRRKLVVSTLYTNLTSTISLEYHIYFVITVHAVDIWNVIEAFREQGLHALESSSELSVARLETLLCSLYHSLNKRAPPTQQAHVDVCSSMLLNWLLAAYATV